MLTLSGVSVTPTSGRAPTIEDIAVSLGRMPRFAGQTRTWWTVLHHSLVCYELMRIEPFADLAHYSAGCLVALLHDAHESVTGDIPTYWKTDDMRVHQRQLDALILPACDDSTRRLMKVVDRRALLAEGLAVGPPGFPDLEGYPEAGDLRVVRSIRSEFPGPSDSNGLDSPAVKRYIQLVIHLQASLNPVKEES